MGERSHQLCACDGLAFQDDLPALLGDPSLLLGEQRDRVRTRTCEDTLELCGAILYFARDELPESRLRLLELCVDARRPLQRPGQRERRGGRDCGAREPTRAHCEVALRLQGERDPCGDTHRGDERRRAEKDRATRQPKGCRGQSRRSDDDAGCEDELEDRPDGHDCPWYDLS